MTSGVLHVALDQPFADQKPGTSGLRKSSRQFETPHYLESFIEAILRTVPGIAGGPGSNGTYLGKPLLGTTKIAFLELNNDTRVEFLAGDREA